jgi:ribosomal protein S18 acetylase RimI-like enzyme
MAEIVRLTPRQFNALRPLLVDLMLEEQRHYDHPQQSRDEIAQEMGRPLRARFRGENVIFAARGADTKLLGLCWCVLFDPGTGLEGEVAELYLAPEARDQGLGHRLVERAMALFRQRGVTFACVWTRAANAAAVRLYQRAGFRPTEQMVLTWLPLEATHPDGGTKSSPLE